VVGKPLSVFDPSGPLRVAADKLYVRSRAGINVFDPKNLTKTLGAISLPVPVADFMVSGARLFAVASPDGQEFSLQTWDITTILKPALLSEIKLPSSQSGSWMVSLSVDRGIATVAEGDQGLLLIDVSKPAAPSILSATKTPGGRAYSVVVRGKYAYVVDMGARGNSGGQALLNVYDIFSPKSPVLMVSIKLTAGGRITLAGNVLAAYDGGTLEFYSLADPAAPAHVQSVAVTGFGDEAFLAAEGDLMYVADGIEGLVIIGP
jgi:hypothetical protein